MPILTLVEKLLGGGSAGVEVREYECSDCGTVFTSAKRPERAQCSECLSNDVTQVGTSR